MNFYKDLYIGYCILSVIGTILLLLLLQWGLPEFMGDFWILIWFILMIIWCIGCAYFFQLKAGKRLNQLAKLRAEECRIEAFMDAWEGFRKQKHLFISTRARNNYEQMIKLNLSVAYLDLGEREKSLEMLLTVPTKFANNAAGATYRLTYYNNLAAVYLRLHNLEQAEQNLVLLKETLEYPGLLKSSRDVFFDAYQSKQILLEMEKGNYEGAEEFFLGCLKKESPKLTRVYNHYYLADIYRHFGNKERERECLTFVTDNGGDSIYAFDADRRLELLKLE